MNNSVIEKIEILKYIGALEKTNREDTFINTRTNRKIKLYGPTVKKIWNDWYRTNKEEIIEAVSERKNNKNNKYFGIYRMTTQDVLTQLITYNNDTNMIVYMEDMIKGVLGYLNIKEILTAKKVCIKWKKYAENIELEKITNDNFIDDGMFKKYVSNVITMRNLTIEEWSNFMLRKKFNAWEYFCTLLIYSRYDLIDTFYNNDSHLPMDHYYYFSYKNKDDSDIHIKYTKYPLILSLIYLAEDSDCYKNLQSKKYFEKIISEDCCHFTKSELCDKIKLYYPDPYSLIPSSNPAYKKYKYNYIYTAAVKKIYNI